ncbi:MAG TPA: rod shape-determining protein RodA [bacterium]|nr:rod shape-determining protein RodA [bacterium]
MIPRKKIDLMMVIPIVTILVLGLFSLNSALSHNISKFHIQLIWVVLSIGVFMFFLYSDIRVFERSAIPLFVANIILLFLVLIIGKKIGGSQRWLDLGFMNFQVSELTKVSIILFIAYRLNMKPTLEDGYNLFDILPEFFATLVPVYLIYKEPDLGTALLVIMTAMIMFLSTKINRKWLTGLIIFIIISSPFIWQYGLKKYQQDRIIALVSFVWSDSDDLSLTTQYHTNQSVIAVGSGQIYGKGYKKGTQNMLRFIPEHHTDFIFSVFAEEFGFTGVSFLLMLYLLLLVKILNLIGSVKDKFSSLILVGGVAHIWLQVLINIGMVTGIMPVVGIPLPWFSYGGSSLIFNAILFGMIHNISINRRYSL